MGTRKSQRKRSSSTVEPEGISSPKPDEDPSTPPLKRSKNLSAKQLMKKFSSGKESSVSSQALTNDDPEQFQESSTRVMWRNKQRNLLTATRGLTSQHRHLMNDFIALLPQCKKEPKLDGKDDIRVVKEIAEIRGCNNGIAFEAKKHRDLYLWLSCISEGISVKCHVQNLHTMDELKLVGNCLRGSRPLLHFDPIFEDFVQYPHLSLLRRMFTRIFGVPRGHPKSKPFIDHIMSFYYLDNRIWIRNYQILVKERKGGVEGNEIDLVEIGPRFVLSPIRIFAGAFGGPTIFSNSQFVSPNEVRAEMRRKQESKYRERKEDRLRLKERKDFDTLLPLDEIDDVLLPPSSTAGRKRSLRPS